MLSRNFHPIRIRYGAWRWEIIESVRPDVYDQTQEYKAHGVVGYNFQKKIRDRKVDDDSKPLLELIELLWPGNWKEQLVSYFCFK